MLLLLRAVAILEGISYLALFAVTMPLKYMADLPVPNKYTGYAHGVLFIAYMVLVLVVGIYKKWGFKQLAILLLAAFLPFATFYADKKYLSEGTALETAS
ncbi:DUF3817 domain-containing protein [Maribacter sp. 2-571]|uniref:DUF3817 domain-containing protein n=1 Tax=Maribacter sp. 2-571 TaxID=3417569 RepID=UPI003D33B1A4